MTSSPKLFELIKALSSNEKRYFQLQVSLQSGQKNYALLFEEMDALEEYDRAYLLAKFKGSKFIKSLHVTENYLFQRIMECLRSYHSDNSVSAKLQNLLFDAELLRKKGFYKLSMDSLNKAEKIAIKHHKYLILAEIIPRKIELIVTDSNKMLIEQLDSLYASAQRNHLKLGEELKYTYFHYWFSLIFRKWRQPKNDKIQQEMENNYGQIIKTPFPEKGSFNSQYYYYSTQSLYWQITGDYEQGNKIHKKILDIWESNPSILKENFSIYIARLANYINNSIVVKKYNLAYSLIEKMEELKTTTFDEAGEQFQNVYFYKLFYFLNLEQYSDAKHLIPYIEQGLLKYDKKISAGRKISFYYNCTIAYFLSNEYEEAVNWLQKILSITRTHEPRKDLQRFARILQLAIYYKLSSNEVLEYMFRSIYRDKKFKSEIHEFEKIALKYFKKLIKVETNSKSEKKLFFSFGNELDEIEDKEKKIIGFEEFYIWVSQMAM
jgi:tetratricopeptide (TPR) repeat protein